MKNSYQANRYGSTKSGTAVATRVRTPNAMHNTNNSMDYIVEEEILKIIKPEIINEVSRVLLEAGLINEFDSVELKLANVVSYQQNAAYKNLPLLQKRNVRYKTRCRTLSLLRAMNLIDDNMHKSLFPQMAFPKDINIGISPSLLTFEIQNIISEKQSVFNKKGKLNSVFSLVKNFLSLFNLT